MDDLKETLHLIVRAQLKKLNLDEEIRQSINEIIQEAVFNSLKELAREVKNGTKQIPQPAAITNDEQETKPERQTTLSPKEDEKIIKPDHSTYGILEEQPTACYVYGIVRGETTQSLGPVGIDNAPVYTFPAGGGLCAVIHYCTPEAYNSPDVETAGKWLFAHQEVLEKVQEQFGTVLPMGFNNIVFVEEQDPRKIMKDWLSEKNQHFSSLLQLLEGKQEFGVKLLVEEEALKKSVLEEDEQLQQIRREMEKEPEGVRYMYVEKLERAVSEALEQKATSYFKEIYGTIQELCEDVQVEKTSKPPAGKRIIASLSCLVKEEKVEQLGQVLSGFDRREGLLVDFTGPWPPYSFVGKIDLP